MYHIGVLKYLQQKPSAFRIERSLGASAGSLIAFFSVLNYPADRIREQFEKVVLIARRSRFGALHPGFNVADIVQEELLPDIPKNVVDLVNHRLFISLTRTDGSNELISSFSSKKDLVEALICSSYLPLFSGYRAPTFRSRRYLDGGLSLNLPRLDSKTILVSPFSGPNKQICPQKEVQCPAINLQGESFYIDRENLKRGIEALKVASDLRLAEYLRSGYSDAQTYFESAKKR